jgi:hypothetical protein
MGVFLPYCCGEVLAAERGPQMAHDRKSCLAARRFVLNRCPAQGAIPFDEAPSQNGYWW